MVFSEILEGHNKKVLEGLFLPENCPYSCESHSASLRSHELIRRKVRFIEDGMVKRSFSYVIVWACRSCRRSFRHLPPFILPLKRYVTETILDKVEAVLSSVRKPYRKTVINDPPRQNSILYEDVVGGRSISHVTVWCWIQWMAAFMDTFLSENPEMAKSEDNESFEFSPRQAKLLKYRESLYSARNLWLGSILTPK